MPNDNHDKSVEGEYIGADESDEPSMSDVGMISEIVSKLTDDPNASALASKADVFVSDSVRKHGVVNVGMAGSAVSLLVFAGISYMNRTKTEKDK
jgi:hypothetical protein